MQDLNPEEQWRKVSPHLDVALTMDESSREEYLASLSATDPALAAELRSLLAEQLHLADFLDGGVAFPGADQPEAIGPYRVLGTLGEGGMGIVYLAQQTEPVKRQLAIKVIRLLGGGKRLMARFAYERQALAMMEHPNIARLYDAGVTAEGHPYFAMEYVAGEPVTKYCDAKRLSCRERVRIFQQVCSAVQHAHQKGVIHRDLKPSNILVAEQDGGVAAPKVIDFGIAKAVNSGLDGGGFAPTQTEAGARIGTPRYMSPEQESGGDIDSTSDIYSLGVVLYELLTGVTPTDLQQGRFGSGASEEIARDRGLASAGALRQILKGDLEWITRKALDPEKGRRYASASEFAADLERYLQNQPVLARAPGAMYTLGKFVRRNHAAAALGVLALLATIGGAVATLHQAQTARAQRDFALRQLERAEEISDLDAFLLYDAAPMGKPFTVLELLERAEKVVEQRSGDSGVSLLLSIGLQYKSAEASDRAKRIIERAYQQSRGISDATVRARASCALATVVVEERQQMSRAKELLREGLRELPVAEAAYALDRSFCLREASSVARHLGEGREAIAQVLAAREELKRAPYHSRGAELALLLDLAESYRADGQMRQSVVISEEADGLLKALGRDRTQRAGTLFNNWALTLNLMGRELEAEPLFRRAIEIGKADAGEGSVSPMLLLNYGRVLAALGRNREASDYVLRARERAQRAGREVVVLQSLIVQNRIFRDLNELERASRVLDEAEVLSLRVYPPGHYVFASIASSRSLTAAAKGEWTEGLRLADVAVQLLEERIRSTHQDQDYLQVLLLRRSPIRLQLGDASGALADAQKSLEILGSPTGFSSELGRAYLALGRAKQALGASDEAKKFYRLAVENLRGTIGEAHSVTVEAASAAAAGS